MKLQLLKTKNFFDHMRGVATPCRNIDELFNLINRGYRKIDITNIERVKNRQQKFNLIGGRIADNIILTVKGKLTQDHYDALACLNVNGLNYCTLSNLDDSGNIMEEDNISNFLSLSTRDPNKFEQWFYGEGYHVHITKLEKLTNLSQNERGNNQDTPCGTLAIEKDTKVEPLTPNQEYNLRKLVEHGYGHARIIVFAKGADENLFNGTVSELVKQLNSTALNDESSERLEDLTIEGVSNYSDDHTNTNVSGGLTSSEGAPINNAQGSTPATIQNGKFKGTVEQLKALSAKDYATITSIDIGADVAALATALSDGSLTVPPQLKEFKFALKGKEEDIDTLKGHIDNIAYEIATQLGNLGREKGDLVKFIADFKDIEFSSQFAQAHPSIIGTKDAASSFVVLANKHPGVDSSKVRTAIIDKVSTDIASVSHPVDLDRLIPGTIDPDERCRDNYVDVIRALVSGLDKIAQSKAENLIRTIKQKVNDAAVPAAAEPAKAAPAAAPQVEAGSAAGSAAAAADAPAADAPAAPDTIINNSDIIVSSGDSAALDFGSTIVTPNTSPEYVFTSTGDDESATPSPGDAGNVETADSSSSSLQAAIDKLKQDKDLKAFRQSVGVTLNYNFLSEHPEAIPVILDAVIAGTNDKHKPKLEALKAVAKAEDKGASIKALIKIFIDSEKPKTFSDASLMSFQQYIGKGTKQNNLMASIIQVLIDLATFRPIVQEVLNEQNIKLTRTPQAQESTKAK